MKGYIFSGVFMCFVILGVLGNASDGFYDFEDGAEGWLFFDYPQVFDVPVAFHSSGALHLQGVSNTSCYGFWQSPQDTLSLETNKLYKAHFLLRGEQENLEEVPQIRLRLNTQDLQYAEYLVIQSLGGGLYSPPLEGRWYTVYFQLPGNSSDVILSLDMINFDPTDAVDGTVSLESAFIEEFDESLLLQSELVRRYDFTTTTEGWVSTSYPDVFAEPLMYHSPGYLNLMSVSNRGLFGFWQSPKELIIEPMTLYCVQARVESDQSYGETVPQFRLRANLENEWLSRGIVIESFGGGETSPTDGHAKTYSFYFMPPQEACYEKFYISFDIVNFNPEDSANALIFLDSVEVRKVNLFGL